LPLAVNKVRYVGEAIAACLAPTRGEAEDVAASIAVDYEVLDAVVDAIRDMHGSPELVHEQWLRPMSAGDLARRRGFTPRKSSSRRLR
jgi:CO/xanthine dehydrogenase Mo-binding subunit